MWLINTTSPQQKRGHRRISPPASRLESPQGSGGHPMAGRALGDAGVKSNGLGLGDREILRRSPANAEQLRSEQQQGRLGQFDTASEQALRPELQAANRPPAKRRGIAETGHADMPELDRALQNRS